MKRDKTVKLQNKQKNQLTDSRLLILSVVIIVLILTVVFSFFIALPKGIGIALPVSSIVILIIIFRSGAWRNTPAAAKKKVVATSLLVVVGIVLFLFPKESGYITQEKGKSWKCECFGFKSWENFPDMAISMSYCNGIVYSCMEK